MTLDSNNNNLMFEIFESLNRQDPDSVRQVLETLYNGVMKIERERHLGVAAHQRSEDRRLLATPILNKAILDKVFYGSEQWAPHVVEKLDWKKLALRVDVMTALKQPSYITQEPDKRVFETHKLLEIPATVDGEPCSLDSSEKWVKYKLFN